MICQRKNVLRIEFLNGKQKMKAGFETEEPQSKGYSNIPEYGNTILGLTIEYNLYFEKCKLSLTNKKKFHICGFPNENYYDIWYNIRNFLFFKNYVLDLWIFYPLRMALQWFLLRTKKLGYLKEMQTTSHKVLILSFPPEISVLNVKTSSVKAMCFHPVNWSSAR